MASNPKEVFTALPHVDTIWITADGNHHLHPHNGGKEVKRENVMKDDDNTDQKATVAKNQAIAAINASKTQAEVEKLLVGETRKDVLEAGAARIKQLTGK